MRPTKGKRGERVGKRKKGELKKTDIGEKNTVTFKQYKRPKKKNQRKKNEGKD